MPIRTWVGQQQMITDSSFNVTMTRGVSRLATLVCTYTKAETHTEKEANTLYFPPAQSEEVEVQWSIGTKKLPVRPTRGCKELYYRGKQALCISATSQHTLSMNYPQFITNSHFQAVDCEAFWGQVEYSGMNLRGASKSSSPRKEWATTGCPRQGRWGSLTMWRPRLPRIPRSASCT